MLGDVGEHVAQIAFRIDAVEFCTADQRVNRGSALTAAIGTGKEIVFPAERNGTQCPLGRIVIDLDAAIVALAGERYPARKRIVDRTG